MHTFWQVNNSLLALDSFYHQNADYLSKAVQNQRAFHEKNMEVYKSAREAYLKKIEEVSIHTSRQPFPSSFGSNDVVLRLQTVEFLKANGISGTAKYAADSLLATVEQAKKVPLYLQDQARDLVGKVGEAWEKLTHYPAGDLVFMLCLTVWLCWLIYVWCASGGLLWCWNQGYSCLLCVFVLQCISWSRLHSHQLTTPGRSILLLTMHLWWVNTYCWNDLVHVHSLPCMQQMLSCTLLCCHASCRCTSGKVLIIIVFAYYAGMEQCASSGLYNLHPVVYIRHFHVFGNIGSLVAFWEPVDIETITLSEGWFWSSGLYKACDSPGCGIVVHMRTCRDYTQVAGALCLHSVK